jgi:hypothetical protein
MFVSMRRAWSALAAVLPVRPVVSSVLLRDPHSPNITGALILFESLATATATWFKSLIFCVVISRLRFVEPGKPLQDAQKPVGA